MNYSVIIPTFNAAGGLGRCIDSILAQAEGQDVEVLVVDDGSTDDSVAITRAYAARSAHVIALATERNSGPGIARNVGVDRASGKWVCFLDADDELEPGFFSALSSHDRDDVDIIAFGARIVQDNADIGTRTDLSYLAEPDRRKLLDNYLLNRVEPSVIFHAFRRDFLNENAIRFHGGLHEDVDYMFRAHQRTRSIAVCQDQLYRKHDTHGSIINTLGESHVRGYFRALNQILDFLDEAGTRQIHLAAFRTSVKNVTSSRIVRLLRHSIEKRDTLEVLLQALFSESSALLARINSAPGHGFQTKYEMMCDLFLSMMSESQPVEKVLEALRDINGKSWSCYDLHNSVFLAPGEIRTCCKRFFADDKLKGDAVLLRDGRGNFSYEDILREKKRMLAEINRNDSEECSGCPFLSFSDWGDPLSSGIKYLSLEHHSICNMRCIYCSDTYYGGKKAAYDIEQVVETAAAAGALANCEYVVWGGGEPLIDQAFPKVASRLSEAVPHVRQRVITNATMFQEQFAVLMERDKAFTVTSIDAGTASVFEKVRGYKYFDRVIGNLKSYAQRAPENMFLKYILMDENSSDEETNAFADLAEANGLLDCNFQVSCNFKQEKVSPDELITLSRLYALLLHKGAHFVFMDDLVWQRLPTMDAKTFAAITAQLSPLYPDTLVTPESAKKVVVWGTGAQAHLLTRKSWVLQQAEISYFVDPRPERVGTTFLGKPVVAPEALNEGDLPVVIAAVQSAPFIYRDLKKLNVPDSRIVKGLLL